MKKLLITATAVLGLLIPSIAKSDIIFYKDGLVKGDVTSKEITLKLCSVSDDVVKLNRDRILGIQTYGNGQLEVILKDDTGLNMNMGYSSTPDCLKIIVKDDKGKEEILAGEDIKKYLLTNNVVPDKDIIAKYDFIKVASQYYKKIGLTPGESFSFYRDDVQERYILVSIDNLKLARNYESMQIQSSFDKEEIKSLEQKLNSEGKDTYLTVVASAGCSLTPSFVVYPNSRFISTIFHEWWHEIREDLPLELNEATATAVGLACAEEFLSKNPEYKKGSFWWESTQTRNRCRGYSNMVVDYYDRLSKLYSSDKPNAEKLRIKEQMLNEMEQKTGYKMNNAELSFAITYCRYFELVSKVVDSYKNLEDAVSALKDIPPGDLESGVKYLEDLLKVEKEKPKLETYH